MVEVVKEKYLAEINENLPQNRLNKAETYRFINFLQFFYYDGLIYIKQNEVIVYNTIITYALLLKQKRNVTRVVIDNTITELTRERLSRAKLGRVVGGRSIVSPSFVFPRDVVVNRVSEDVA